MCWSVQADLAAGAVVCGAGLICLARARRAERRGRSGLLPLAALPLLLGVHQLLEAAVWLAAEGRFDGPPAQWARTVWALIALPVLPVLVPVGVWRATRASSSPGRRRTVAALAVLGVLVAVPLALAVATGPVTARAEGHTLAYGVGVPHPALLLTGYLVATVGSLLVSGDRTLRLLGLLVGTGAVVCALLWQTAFVSTWCALAALVSVVLIRWTGPPPRPRPQEHPPA
ncbi:DUF6629 family protein [Kitasatospora sp. NPDC004240]